MRIEHIVFYGTLQTGYTTSVHSSIQRGLDHIGDCVFLGTLYDHGRYPALKPGDHQYTGELYRITSESILSQIDKYEAVDNDDPTLPGFTRRPLKLVNPAITAWAYYYDGPVDSLAIVSTYRWSPRSSKRK